MATKTMRLQGETLDVPQETMWSDALIRAQAKLDVMGPVIAPKLTAKQLREKEMRDRAEFGPPPPPFDLDWLLTPAPYPEFARGLLTPEMAAKLLDVMVANRHPQGPSIVLYSRLMGAKRWWFTNECWAIDNSGHLQDGGNRAAACVLSGETIDIGMFRGMHPRNFTHLNQGARRTGRHTFEIDEEKNAGHLSTAVDILLQYQQWREKTHLMWRKLRVANDERDEMKAVAGDPLRRGVAFGFNVRKLCGTSVGAVGAAYYLLTTVAPEDIVIQFFDSLAMGNNLDKDDPVAVLRNDFIGKLLGGRRMHGGEAGYDMYVQVALILKAWGMIQLGERVKERRIAGRRGFLVIPFSAVEPFPTPIPYKGS